MYKLENEKLRMMTSEEEEEKLKVLRKCNNMAIQKWNKEMVDIKKIRSIRREKGISREEMAEFLGLNTLSYKNKEYGQRQFNIGELFRVAQKFDMTMEDLLIIPWRLN